MTPGSPRDPRPENPPRPAQAASARPTIRPAQSENWRRSLPEASAGSGSSSAPPTVQQAVVTEDVLRAGATSGTQAVGPRTPGTAMYWTDDRRIRIYRSAEGIDYYGASDGIFYPTSTRPELFGPGPRARAQGTVLALGADAGTRTPASADAFARTANGTDGVGSGAVTASALAVGATATGATTATTSTATSPAGTGEVEESTYYEYLAAHSAESPAAGTAGPATGSTTATSATAAGTGPGSPPDGTGGTGSSRRGRTRWIGTVIAGVLVIALLCFLGVRWFSPAEGVVPSSEASTPSGEPRETADDSASPASPTADPASVMSETSEADTRTAKQDLDDRWVVQLSAKQTGMETEGRTWTSEDILDEYEANQEKYGNTLLLWSDDWSTFSVDGYWVTVLDEGYDSPEGALTRCTQLDLDRDHCFAKKLSTTAGPEGATKLNP